MPAPKIELIDGVYDLRRTFDTVLPYYFFNRIIKGEVRESVKPEGGFIVDVSTTAGNITSKRYVKRDTASQHATTIVRAIDEANATDVIDPNRSAHVARTSKLLSVDRLPQRSTNLVSLLVAHSIQPTRNRS